MGEGKDRYWLLAPTPDPMLREMTTDRPDLTETPFTVDAGHVQIESNILGYARSRPDADGAITDAFDLATTNVRIGLTNDSELSLVWQPYGWTRAHAPGMDTHRSDGVGGFDVRAKVNLSGNDDFAATGWALALLPYVTLPVDSDNGISPAFVAGGLVVPLAVVLPHDFGLGINAGMAWVKEESASDYREYSITASLAHAWSDRLGAYYELAATFPQGQPGDVVTAGAGITYALTDNLQLDAGMNVGLTRTADRINPFVGLSQRF